MSAAINRLIESVLPNKPSKDTELLIKIADCVLGDRCVDERDRPFRHPINNVVACITKAIASAISEDCEGFLTTYDPTGPLVKARLPELLGIGSYTINRRNLRDYTQDTFSYSCDDEVFVIEDFERKRSIIEAIWCCPVIIERMPDNPLGVTIRPGPAAPAPVSIAAVIPLTNFVKNQVVLGTDVFTGQVIAQRISELPHMLVAGTSGFGKSVFLNQLVTQLLAADPAEVAEIVLIDLKGGVEFHGYARRSNRVKVVWEYPEVVKAVEHLMWLLQSRLEEMVRHSLRLYPGRRVFFIVDEFAQIQLYPRQDKEEKAEHDRLIASLNRLSMLGRAVGIVLIAAIQKATTDVMDSSFRMNLQGQVCFRVPNRLMASTMFGSVDDLLIDPMKLPRGRFIYYDPIGGTTRYLQAHVAA